MSLAAYRLLGASAPAKVQEGPRSHFNLLRWFSICSFLILAIGGIAMGVLLGRFIASHMLMRDSEVSRDFIESIAATEDSYLSFAPTGPDPLSRDALSRFVQHIPTLPGVVNANLYALDGTVLWSSENSLVGQRFSNNDELERALGGTIVVTTGVFTPGDVKAEHSWIRDKPDSAADARFVEAYLPIRDNARERVIAVVEIYKLPRSLFRSIDRGVQLVWISAAVFGIALYGALFWIVRKADGLIRDQQERLIETEALSAVGEMSAAVAHSIRNPLSSIRSAAEIAQEEDGPELAAALKDITGQADRIDGWIRDMLAACREGTVPLERIDLCPLLHEALIGLSGEIGARGIVVEMKLPEAAPARGSRASLLHAFRNIVSNAVDAMPEGGRLTFTCVDERGNWRIDVQDTGEGIAPQAIRRVFRPFYTTKSNGSGLGLSLTRRIVERYGGTVEILSRQKEGTLVSVLLPREG